MPCTLRLTILHLREFKGLASISFVELTAKQILFDMKGQN
jgi:hypothetical protein